MQKHTLLYYPLYIMASLKTQRAPLMAQKVKNLPAMHETPVQFLGLEDPLEKG